MFNSLESLFGSKARVQLLKIFFEHPDKMFYLRELARKTKLHFNSIRREVLNLQKIGLLKICEKDSSQSPYTYFQLDHNFIFFQELQNIILKYQLSLQIDFLKQIKEVGDLRFLAFLGYFVGDPKSPIDVFIVGKMNKNVVQDLIHGLENEIGRSLNYTFLTPEEFEQRKRMTDKFLYAILEAKKNVIFDNLNNLNK